MMWIMICRNRAFGPYKTQGAATAAANWFTTRGKIAYTQALNNWSESYAERYLILHGERWLGDPKKKR